MHRVILALSVFFFIACNDGDTTYTIKEGNHYSTNRGIRIVKGNSISFTAKFISGASYTTQNPDDQFDINKLYGFREGISEDNSARIGWAWLNKKIVLYPYVHCNGEHMAAEGIAAIDSVDQGDEINCSIIADGSFYRFVVNGNQVIAKRCAKGSPTKYYLFPYFGGNATAPNDIVIRIKDR